MPDVRHVSEELRALRLDVHPAPTYLTLRRLQQAAEHPQQAGLAAAVRTLDLNNLPRCEREIQTRE